MIWTTDQIADAVWTHPTRTIDGLAPASSDGSTLDNIAYAVWTFGTRTVEGGTGFSFVVAESMPAPSQASGLQTVMPVTVSELTLTPEQAAIAGTSINVIIDETTLTPVQVITAETVGGGKKNKPWASYYPPILTIRTNGVQEAPAPGERVRAKFTPKHVPIKVIEAKPVYSTMARQSTPAPIQDGRVKSHREVKAMRQEEQDILALLASL
jgi:hypothetical protein